MKRVIITDIKPKNTTPKVKPKTETVIEGQLRDWLGRKMSVNIVSLLRRKK